MSKSHQYEVTIEWTGNRGTGTSSYQAYGRSHDISADDKAMTIPGTADPQFLGESDRWNPEEMLVASLSQCHMLWYLHLAAEAGVVVTDYVDTPLGTMTLSPNGSGQFSGVTLRPIVEVANTSMVDKALSLHQDASTMCFIAKSVNFPVSYEPAVHPQAD